MEKVSFILGIYNAERTIAECLDSITSQDYPKKDYEIIVVDGGSTDSTLKIVRNFAVKNKNLRIIHNPHKLSEGKGMGKAQGVKASKGKFLVFLDHDNILVGKLWLKQMLFPFKDDSSIMASQSMLKPSQNDSTFLKYINSIGVEDAFAAPNSLVAQAVIHPGRFDCIKGRYYSHVLDRKNVLFGGANGCIFKKEVFRIIQGYTRDVNVFDRMAKHSMKVAVVKNAFVHHKTSSRFSAFLRKKILYFQRFLEYGYKESTFQWIEPSFSGKLRFYLKVLNNLLFVGNFFTGFKQFMKTGQFFWLLHPFYAFCMTAVYAIAAIFNFRGFLRYFLRKS